DCQLNIVKKGVQEEEIRRQTCIAAPNPSVIMTNQVIGSMMANEARTVIDPEMYGAPINGVLKYTGNLDSRWGLNRIQEACSCEEKPLVVTVPDTMEEEKKEIEIKTFKRKGQNR
ncbi:TPA: hypothetical protein HA265_02035, partial [Candidatus Woesearchaeota archaeon]|nr:hypothetical protein [Candidatus Woesearchaeota archaeon]